MPTIICDTRQQTRNLSHKAKEKYFADNGINILRSKLPCGDYSRMDDMSTVIDTKDGLQEVVSNVCGKEHERFRNECVLAQENGIKLIILVEDDTTDKNGRYIINDIRDVRHWQNPRRSIMETKVINGVKCRVQKYPKATTGMVLMKAMYTMQLRYGVEWRICRKADAGRVICEILGIGGDTT